jgi:hypothetical protein
MPNDEADIKTAAIKIAEIKADLALLRLRLALRAYDPDQPRWPAGQPDGGQWRPGDGNSGPNNRVAGRIKPGRQALCDEQMASDSDACRATQSQLCWSLVLPRYNACLRDEYIPPLLHEVPEE